MGYMSLMFDCANCGRYAMANPELVLSIPASWDAEQGRFVADPNGSRQPVCRACARLALERMRSGDPTLTRVAPALREPDWLERAYGTAQEVD